MNCPKCRKGFMERLGGIDLTEGRLKLTVAQEGKHPYLEIYVCSRGDCGEVELRSIRENATTYEQLSGYIELKPGPLELRWGDLPRDVAALELRIDSGVQIKAAPDSYSLAKRSIRALYHQQMRQTQELP